MADEFNEYNNDIEDGEADSIEDEMEALRKTIKYQQAMIDDFHKAKQAEIDRQNDSYIVNNLINKSEYNLSPEEASALINKITSDKNSPYMNERAPHAERQRVIALVDRLYLIKNKLASSVEGYWEEYQNQSKERMKSIYNDAMDNKSSEFGNHASEQPDTRKEDIGYAEKDKSSASGHKIEDAFK